MGYQPRRTPVGSTGINGAIHATGTVTVSNKDTIMLETTLREAPNADSEQCAFTRRRPGLRTSTAAVFDHQSSGLSLAACEISEAWARYRQSASKHFRDGLDFGKVCR